MNLQEIGIGAVLDTSNLRDGDVVTIMDHNNHEDGVFRVKLMPPDAIALQPLVGMELWRYRSRKLWLRHKFLIVFFVLAGVLSIAFWLRKG